MAFALANRMGADDPDSADDPAALARRLAGRWLAAPRAEREEYARLSAQLRDFAPSLARCKAAERARVLTDRRKLFFSLKPTIDHVPSLNQGVREDEEEGPAAGSLAN
mmetsp:Transcript_16254/g.43802  ORF Transcript_16254/g.43802 Transcript_16254/m.43802 type:complete len:108 (+) Transcript_16254:55-378(+)